MIPLYTEEQFKQSSSKEKLPCKCESCGNTFYSTKSLIKQELKEKRGRIRFCNQICHGAKYKEKQTVNLECYNCNTSFTRRKGELKEHKIYKDKFFCSRKCFNIFYGNDYIINNDIQIHANKRQHYKNVSKLDRKNKLIQLGYDEAKRCNDPFMFLCWGLYWGEGGKTCHSVKLSNMDNDLIKVFIKGMIKFYNVDINKFVARIHCYTSENNNYNDIEQYWKKELDLPNLRFTKPTIKSSNNIELNNKKPYGVLHLLYHSSEILYRILGAIKYLSESQSN
jgi:hypothetical protein